MPKKKHKRMTQKEKNERKKIREELRAEGILPPVKKRLNRAAFMDEALEEFSEFSKASGIGSLPSKNRNMHIAVMAVAHSQMSSTIGSEQIGALKVMKISAALEKFDNECRGDYDFDEMMKEVVQPILDL